MAALRILLALCLLAPALAPGEPPSRPFNCFEAAKKAARDGIYSEHHTDFYFGCVWTPNRTGTAMFEAWWKLIPQGVGSC